MIRAFFAAVMVIASGALAGTPPASNPWSEVSRASAGASQAIGFYSHGCLGGGVELPPDGPGYQVVRLSRHRNFGHADLVDYIRKLGLRSQQAGLPPVQVGDMAQPRGGPLPYGHLSHQIGLDADLWFTFGAAAPPPPPTARETPDLPSMLLANGRAVDPRRFSTRQIRLLQLAADDPRVDRIFVNPVIKRALCARLASPVGPPSRPEWLHRISPWWGHDDHFHVRLKCPAGSAACEPQAPVAAGDGCDASLAWWPTPRAAKPPPPAGREAGVAPASPQAPRRLPDLPAACAAILHAAP